MEKDKLTKEEKATLVAVMDRNKPDVYDLGFFQELSTLIRLKPEDIDDGKRRAINRYLKIHIDILKKRLPPTNPMIEAPIMGMLAIMFVNGYELGRKLQTPLTRK